MALKALKCPNCEANIQVDDGKDIGFCSYCGTQVQIEKVVEVYSEEEFDADRFGKLMEDSQAYLKMGNYFRAEEGFMEMIRLYPGKAIGYERLICVITRNYTLFPMENAERLQQLKKKMMLVAEEDEKPHYEEVCKRVEFGFSNAKWDTIASEKTVEIAKLRSEFISSLIAAGGSIISWILMREVPENNLLEGLLFLAVIVSGGKAIVTRVKINNLEEEDE